MVQKLRNTLPTYNMDIQYSASAIYSPSDYGFARDGIVSETGENLEMVAIGEVDLEVLRRGRENGTVRHLRDRRHDVYNITYNQ